MISNTPQPKTLKQKLIEQSAGIRQWERVTQEQSMSKQGRLLRRLVRINQDAYAKKVGVDVKDQQDLEEDESVRIGDEFREVHYHDQSWKSIATAAGIVLVTLAIAVSTWLFSHPSATPASQVDTDTQYDLEGDWELQE